MEITLKIKLDPRTIAILDSHIRSRGISTSTKEKEAMFQSLLEEAAAKEMNNPTFVRESLNRMSNRKTIEIIEKHL